MRDTKPILVQPEPLPASELKQEMAEVWMKIEDSINEHEVKQEMDNFIKQKN